MTTKIPANLLESTLDLSSHTLTLPPNGSRAGDVVQMVSTTSSAVMTSSTVLPWDDTIPQNTEGEEFMTLSITPKHANNKLKIEVVAFGTISSNGPLSLALFQDSTAGALAATASHPGSAGIAVPVTLTHHMTAGTTSATTFKLRVGPAAAATATMNGTAGARRFGGVASSSITITEYKV